MAEDQPSIECRPNGPLKVQGLPLTRKSPVMSEHGEPLSWSTSEELTDKDRYFLCRCGLSSDKPYCDGTHKKQGWEAEDSDPGPYDERATNLGGSGITVRDDRSICVHAGFCGNRETNVWDQVSQTSATPVRVQVIAEVEHCPSGALTYRAEGSDSDLEPDYRPGVGIIDDGPLWVTGGVEITLADGTSLERRNRVTLCRCGASGNKPLCDGKHKDIGFTES